MPSDCWECSGLGDDYYLDETGERVSACSNCPLNEYEEDDDG